MSSDYQNNDGVDGHGTIHIQKVTGHRGALPEQRGNIVSREGLTDCATCLCNGTMLRLAQQKHLSRLPHTASGRRHEPDPLPGIFARQNFVKQVPTVRSFRAPFHADHLRPFMTSPNITRREALCTTAAAVTVAGTAWVRGGEEEGEGGGVGEYGREGEG